MNIRWLPFLFVATLTHAAVVGKTVVYHDGATELEGYVAYDDSKTGTRPAVVVVPDWMGPSDFSRNRAEELAKLGYVAMAADIYGKGVRPKDAKEAMALVQQYKGNRALLRSRVRAAYQTLLEQPQADAARTGAIGYCFGGTAVLELARSGAPVNAIVTFHGGLDTPTPQDAKNIKAKILVLHGADDPHVPPSQVADFEKEMKAAAVDYKIIKYPGAVHAFAVPTAGSDKRTGAAYDPVAAKKAWQAMKDFFSKILG